MKIRWDLEKSIEAAAVVIRAHPNRRISRLRLLKIMYWAERESLRRSGRMITGDRVVAMDQGPVLSNIYDLIKGQNINTSRWEEYIVPDGGYAVFLHEDPGLSHLSKMDVDILHEAVQKFENVDDYEIVKFMHNNCPEWTDPHGTSKPIALGKILEEVGLGGQKDAILADMEVAEAFDAFFSSPTGK